MKALFFLFFLVIAIQSNASVLGRGVSESGSGKVFDRILAPEFQVTQYGDKDGLLETGNSNLLKNPSLESHVLLQNWTGAGGVTPALNTSNVAGGKRAATISFTSLNGVIVHQDVTPTIKMQGRNWEYGAWVSTTTSNIQVCAREGGVKVDPCQNVISDGVGRFYPIIRAGPASGSVGVEIRTSASTTGSISFDDGYLGLARNLSSVVPPNTFSAVVSDTGVVTNEAGGDWINGNFTQSSGNFNGTFSSGFFTSAPNCTGSLRDSSSSDQTMNRIASDSTSVNVQTKTGAGTGTSIGFTLICTKTGSDYIQPAITPQNYNFGSTFYTSTVSNLGAGSATVSATYSRQGSNATVCISATKDGSGGSGSGTVSFTYPPGVVIDTTKTAATGSVIGVGYTSINNNNFSLVASASGLVFFNGNNDFIGSAFPASQTIRGCVTFPVVGWTETQNAPLLLNTVYADTAIKADKSAGLTSVDYGTYSATATNVTNATSITSPIPCSYFRIGSKVDVTCRTSTGCTTASGTNTKLDITLPIATTQTTTIIGTMGAAISGESGRVLDNGSNLARMDFFCQTTSPVTRPIDFTYQVP